MVYDKLYNQQKKAPSQDLLNPNLNKGFGGMPGNPYGGYDVPPSGQQPLIGGDLGPKPGQSGAYTGPPDTSIAGNLPNIDFKMEALQAPTIKLPNMNPVRSALDKQFAASREALNMDLARQFAPARERAAESLSERGLTGSGLGDRMTRMSESDLTSQSRQAFLELQSQRMAAEADLARQQNEQEFNKAIQEGNWQQAIGMHNQTTQINLKQMTMQNYELANAIAGTKAQIWVNKQMVELDRERLALERDGMWNDQYALYQEDKKNALLACGEANQTDGDLYNDCVDQEIAEIYDHWGDLGIQVPGQGAKDRYLASLDEENKQKKAREAAIPPGYEGFGGPGTIY